MESKRKARVHPLNSATSTLLCGHIMEQANQPGGLQVVDQWDNAYPIDAQCHLLPALQAGDEVLFCLLDDQRVAVLNRLISPLEADKIQEFTLPGVADSFIRITEQGIQLQAGKTALLIQKDGTISLDARNLEQTAQENLRIKGGIVRIN